MGDFGALEGDKNPWIQMCLAPKSAADTAILESVGMGISRDSGCGVVGNRRGMVVAKACVAVSSAVWCAVVCWIGRGAVWY